MLTAANSWPNTMPGATASKQHATKPALNRAIFNSSRTLFLKLPVPPHSRRELLRAGTGFARLHCRDSVAVLILQRGIERHRPRLVCRHSVAAHASLRKAGDLLRELARLRHH